MCVCIRMGCEYTPSIFYRLTFMLHVHAAVFLKKRNTEASKEMRQKLLLRIMNGKKSHKRASLIVEISDIQGSFRRSQLPVSLCGGSPQGTLPLFRMEEAYGRVHHICALLCCCAGCLSLLLLYQEAAHCLHQPSRSTAANVTIKNCFV